MATATGIANRALSRLGALRVAAIPAATSEAARAIGDPASPDSAFAICRDEVLRAHPWKCAERFATAISTQKVVTGITKANPAVVTSAAHALVAGQVIRFADVVGMTEINGLRAKVAAPVNANDFTLDELDGDNLDTSGAGYSAYVSGGTVTLVPLMDYENLYPLPGDCLRVLSLEDELPGEHWTTQGRFLLCNRTSPISLRYTTRLEVYSEYDSLLVSAFAARLAAELAEEITQSTSKRQLALAELDEVLEEAKKANAREQTPSEPIESEWLTERLLA